MVDSLVVNIGARAPPCQSAVATNKWLQRIAREAKSRLEFRIPVKIIHPAFMQIIGWKEPAILMKVEHRRFIWRLLRIHPCSLGHLAAFFEITRRTSRHHILPGRLPTLRTRNKMVEGQIIGRRTILAGKAVPEKHIKAREGRVKSRPYI